MRESMQLAPIHWQHSKLNLGALNQQQAAYAVRFQCYLTILHILHVVANDGFPLMS